MIIQRSTGHVVAGRGAPAFRAGCRPAGRAARRLALILGALALAGCASHYGKLSPVADLPQLARLQGEREDLASAIVRVPVEDDGGQPLRLAMEEVGPGDREPLVVLLHGVLSDRQTWRFVAGDLGRDHDLLLIDLLGCGESDRPDPDRLGPGGYSPTAHARRVLQALRAYGNDRELSERLALVGHSLGGTVVLRMRGDEDLRSEFADVVDRVDHVVLLSPLDVAVEKVHPTFASIARLGGTKVGLARLLGLLSREVTRTSLEGMVDPSIATREDARRLALVLRQRSSRRPAQAMIREAVPFHEKPRRPDWDRIQVLEEDYGAVSVSTLILWGERDETLPVSMGYKLQAQLPRARLRIVTNSMHSLQLERPLLAAALIRDFLGGGGADSPAIAEVVPLPAPADPVLVASSSPTDQANP